MTRRRWPWFFVVILAVASINWAGSETVEVPLGDGIWARLIPLAGAVMGAIWQLVDRRDLTKRLTVAAVLFVVAGLLQAVTGDVFTEVPGVFTGIGLVAGLVLAEQWLRRVDSTHKPVPPAEVQPALND
jgi:peptidoglycan/LPS O-acetylase OafA/YrhL